MLGREVWIVNANVRKFPRKGKTLHNSGSDRLRIRVFLVQNHVEISVSLLKAPHDKRPFKANSRNGHTKSLIFMQNWQSAQPLARQMPKPAVRFILVGDEFLIEKTKGLERRKWHRLPLALPVFLRSVDAAGKESLEFATGLNVSAGGMLVASRRALPLTGQALLEIPVAPFALPSSASKVSRKLQARIVRVIHGEDFHLIGMRFQRPLEDGRILRSPAKRKPLAKPSRKNVTSKG